MGVLSAIPPGNVLQKLGEGNNQVDVQQLEKRIKGDLHPGQLAFVEDQTTQIIGLSAGYGAGKTRALAAKSVILALANQGFIGCVMEPTGPLVRDIWQNDFETFLEAMRSHTPSGHLRCRNMCFIFPVVTRRSFAAALRTGQGSLA